MLDLTAKPRRGQQRVGYVCAALGQHGVTFNVHRVARPIPLIDEHASRLRFTNYHAFVMPRVVAVVASAFAALLAVSVTLRHLQAALAMAVLAAVPLLAYLFSLRLRVRTFADPPDVAKPEKGQRLKYCGKIVGAAEASIMEMSGRIEREVSAFLLIPGFHTF